MNADLTVALSLLDSKGFEYFGEHYDEPIIELAHLIYAGSLLSVTTDKLTIGTTTVVVSAFNSFDEYTPKTFEPNGLLEKVLWNQPKAFNQKIDFPIEYKRADLWKAFGVNLFKLSIQLGSRMPEVTKSYLKQDSIMVELYSQRLKRSLYIDFYK